MTLLSGALLNILNEAGEAVLTLTEGLEPEEFFASRLTQREVIRQMRILAETAASIPPEIKTSMVEIDWAGWSILGAQLNLTGGLDSDTLWFGVRSLVPATLMWMRVFRSSSPGLFSFSDR